MSYALDTTSRSIIEAYTFNFSVSYDSYYDGRRILMTSVLQYCKVPGSDSTVPVMSLGEDMMNLSLAGSKKGCDPVADAMRNGKIPTLGEVKRSLKVRS